ncbi:RlmE family RNA methyltransferase [Desulfohalobium retbaense]|jgi:23S rRNA (uridine2552-2'-O)-methyltransferase|uniref:Ribosomal RNA large subunit methyltransferase E n=1 Tax=Desulfohalobium retbaense (strain ATCC 49708 / DSM 5692 / JCM 16813 / HR100) TaxID=485915 RepID=C8X3N6_DESRD|nr:RlmE family RNA methyltransferase [Desulfohalobium retbaense]ACV69033.1 ribosomal RNA methyltransferase RrmJ/FtsJ [Desulfohalobium retbaense DSM 5692]
MKKYRDHYFKRAKQDNYPARSVYKLQELDKRFQFLAKGQRILDLGAAPGSWTLFAAKKTGAAGRVVAVDLQAIDIELPDHVTALQDDLLHPSPRFAEVMGSQAPFDVVLSDMAPKTTGVKITDQARSLELAEMARDVALDTLKTPGGTFVVKIFEGPDVPQYVSDLRQYFKKVKTAKPKSSRAESKEIFVMGFGFKGQE